MPPGAWSIHRSTRARWVQACNITKYSDIHGNIRQLYICFGIARVITAGNANQERCYINAQSP